MKKNNLTLFMFVVLGLFIGTLVGHLVSIWTAQAWISEGLATAWQPKGDWGFLNYQLDIRVNWNIGSLAGIVLAVWLFRKW